MARGQVDYLQDQFEESDPVEDESDLRGSSPSELSDAVVQGTDWTTATLLDQIERGRIQLNPNFQRRDAWTRERKSKFIESLMLGFPIPQIVLAESKGQRGKFIVIDGKQRLLSLIQFAGSEENLSSFERLRLTKLEILDQFNGLTLEELQSDNSAVYLDEW